MTPRSVKFPTLFALLRKRGPLPLLGLMFTFMSLFVILPTLLMVMASLREPYEKYDYEAITRNGTEQTARITAIETVPNVTINGEHPRLISYTYPQGSQVATDRFETMDAAGVAALQEGATVRIKALNGESVIPTLEPFAFPFQFFFILPLIFFVLGAVFLLIGIGPVLKEYALYKTGVAHRAVIQGITTRTMSLRNAKQTWLVSYRYTTSSGQPVLGESVTDDLLLVQGKQFGDTVDILVAPDDESRSCLLPRLEAVRNDWQL